MANYVRDGLMAGTRRLRWTRRGYDTEAKAREAAARVRNAAVVNVGRDGRTWVVEVGRERAAS